MATSILPSTARPSSWLRSVITGRVSEPHPLKDWPEPMRRNAAACVKARSDYDAHAKATFEVTGHQAPDFDSLPTSEKQRLVLAEYLRLKPTPRPVRVTTACDLHLTDALEASVDLSAALHDALKASTADLDVATLIDCLERSAILAAKVSQLRKGGAA